MTDTSKAVGTRYAEALLSLPPARRIEMACSMFATAKALALAGIRAGARSHENGERVALFLRLYGRDLTGETRARVVAQLDRAA